MHRRLVRTLSAGILLVASSAALASSSARGYSREVPLWPEGSRVLQDGINKRSYAPVDDIDRVSLRPDFAIPVYPGHMTMEHKNKTPQKIAAQQLNTDIVVSSRVPPTLLVHARDDTVDPVHYSQVYARELKKAGVDVELKIYETGGHAFGVRKQGKDTDRWMADALRWLRKKKIL